MYEVCSAVVTAPTYCGIYLLWLEQSKNLGRRYNQDCKYPEILTSLLLLLQNQLFSNCFLSPTYFPEPVKALANYLLFSLFVLLPQFRVCALCSDISRV